VILSKSRADKSGPHVGVGVCWKSASPLSRLCNIQSGSFLSCEMCRTSSSVSPGVAVYAFSMGVASSYLLRSGVGGCVMVIGVCAAKCAGLFDACEQSLHFVVEGAVILDVDRRRGYIIEDVLGEMDVVAAFVVEVLADGCWFHVEDVGDLALFETVLFHGKCYVALECGDDIVDVYFLRGEECGESHRRKLTIVNFLKVVVKTALPDDSLLPE